MKNIGDLNEEIASVTAGFEAIDRPTKGQRRKASVRIRFIRDCILYLERGATREALEKKYSELYCKVEAMESGFSVWMDNNPHARTKDNAESMYRREVGIPTMKRHLKNIDWILA